MKNYQEIAIALANKLRQDALLRQGSPVETITKALSEAYEGGFKDGYKECEIDNEPLESSGFLE